MLPKKKQWPRTRKETYALDKGRRKSCLVDRERRQDRKQQLRTDKETSAIDRGSSYPENRGRAKKGKPDQWIKEDFQTRSSVHAHKIKPVTQTEKEFEVAESVKDIFKEEMKTSVINKSKIKAKVSTQEFLETHLRSELIFSFE